MREYPYLYTCHKGMSLADLFMWHILNTNISICLGQEAEDTYMSWHSDFLGYAELISTHRCEHPTPNQKKTNTAEDD